jgi:hypothetical protein
MSSTYANLLIIIGRGLEACYLLFLTHSRRLGANLREPSRMGLGHANSYSCHRLGIWLCNTRLFEPFGDRKRDAGMVWNLGYAKRNKQFRVRAWLRETGLLEGLIMRTDAAGVVWGLGYAIQRCLRRLAAWLCVTRLLASLGGWDMQKTSC